MVNGHGSLGDDHVPELIVARDCGRKLENESDGHDGFHGNGGVVSPASDVHVRDCRVHHVHRVHPVQVEHVVDGPGRRLVDHCVGVCEGVARDADVVEGVARGGRVCGGGKRWEATGIELCEGGVGGKAGRGRVCAKRCSQQLLECHLKPAALFCQVASVGTIGT